MRDWPIIPDSDTKERQLQDDGGDFHVNPADVENSKNQIQVDEEDKEYEVAETDAASDGS